MYTKIQCNSPPAHTSVCFVITCAHFTAFYVCDTDSVETHKSQMMWLMILKSMTLHKTCITKIDVKCTNVTSSYINTKMTELYVSIYHLRELKNRTPIRMIIHE